MERRDKINYYLDLAEAVAQRSTCLRRHFGAVIVKDDEVISTGYSGAPRGRENCTDLNYCVRTRLNVPRGERYELCRSVHAEMNAVISAARNHNVSRRNRMRYRRIRKRGEQLCTLQTSDNKFRNRPCYYP